MNNENSTAAETHIVANKKTFPENKKKAASDIFKSFVVLIFAFLIVYSIEVLREEIYRFGFGSIYSLQNLVFVFATAIITLLLLRSAFTWYFPSPSLPVEVSSGYSSINASDGNSSISASDGNSSISASDGSSNISDELTLYSEEFSTLVFRLQSEIRRSESRGEIKLIDRGVLHRLQQCLS